MPDLRVAGTDTLDARRLLGVGLAKPLTGATGTGAGGGATGSRARRPPGDASLRLSPPVRQPR